MQKSLFEDIRTAKQGMFDPTKRYSVKNITGEEFEFKWNGVDIKMKVDETLELPQYLAYNAVNKMIDQLIQGEQTKELMKIRETNPSFIQVNGAGKMGVPAFRLTYENRIVKELSPKTGNDAKLDIVRLREQVEADIRRSQEESKPVEAVKVAETEFAGLTDHPAATIA